MESGFKDNWVQFQLNIDSLNLIDVWIIKYLLQVFIDQGHRLQLGIQDLGFNQGGFI
jgi:hypothetical protein